MMLTVVLAALQMSAEGQPRKFDPKQFEADLEQYITTQAGLSPQEAAKFFPLFKEMQDKQRLLFNKMRTYRHVDVSDNKASLEAIKACDESDLQIKKIQMDYHEKFCKILPAGTVMKIIKAEERFHRKMFKRMAKPQ
jgi:hypothetical protein